MAEMGLEYLAGFIDGEGHIGIKRSRQKGVKNPIYSERISVAGTNKLSIETFQLMWPGSFSYHHPGKNSQAGYWSWELTNKKAQDFLRIIEPYLLIKNLDAKIVLALSKRKTITRRSKLSDPEIALRESLYQVLKAKRRMLWSK